MPPQEHKKPAGSSKEQGSIRPRRLFAPLRFKLFMLLVLVLLPPFALAALLSGALRVPSTPALVWILSGNVSVYQYHVRLLYLCGAGLFLVCLVCGMTAADVLFVRPARHVLAFLIELRRRDFASVPVLPAAGADEIGEIARQAALSANNLARMREEASEASAERELFIMTVAHQLRTPLTGLSWIIEGLRKPETSASEKHELLGSLDTTLQRMRLITEHILASAAIEEGRFGYVFEKTDMVPLAQRLVEECKPLLQQRGVELALDAEGAFPVFVDRERVMLALFNLVANAIQYTPQGGLVTLSLRPKGERLEVSVTDTGIGISESERPRLFEKFYRSERARHMRPDGSGLGLYLAKTIIEKHGSPIAIESSEGKGTRMSFFLHTDRANVY